MSIVKINAIEVPAERADMMAQRFAARAGEVGCPGRHRPSGGGAWPIIRHRDCRQRAGEPEAPAQVERLLRRGRSDIAWPALAAPTPDQVAALDRFRQVAAVHGAPGRPRRGRRLFRASSLHR